MRRVGFGLVGLVVGSALLLFVEIQIARHGTDLPEQDFDLDIDAPPEIPGVAGHWLRLLWLGDSTAAGVGASEAAATMPRVVAQLVGRPLAQQVLAVSGAQVADVIADQLPKVAAFQPDVVLISVGANDTTHLTRPGAFRKRYTELLRGLPEGVKVILLGVPDMGAPTRLAQPLRAIAGWQGRRLDAEVVTVARAAGAAYVDIEGETGPAFRRDPGRYFAADDFHPSNEGYTLWAIAVIEVLNRIV